MGSIIIFHSRLEVRTERRRAGSYSRNCAAAPTRASIICLSSGHQPKLRKGLLGDTLWALEKIWMFDKRIPINWYRNVRFQFTSGSSTYVYQGRFCIFKCHLGNQWDIKWRTITHTWVISGRRDKAVDILVSSSSWFLVIHPGSCQLKLQQEGGQVKIRWVWAVIIRHFVACAYPKEMDLSSLVFVVILITLIAFWRCVTSQKITNKLK